ncbi:MAG: serine/threonine-protein phosphatase [Oligoflexales bacterium]|nr:serine/threonine-protein phosphatase [Oligoflexales bacterium]
MMQWRRGHLKYIWNLFANKAARKKMRANTIIILFLSHFLCQSSLIAKDLIYSKDKKVVMDLYRYLDVYTQKFDEDTSLTEIPNFVPSSFNPLEFSLYSSGDKLEIFRLTIVNPYKDQINLIISQHVESKRFFVAEERQNRLEMMPPYRLLSANPAAFEVTLKEGVNVFYIGLRSNFTPGYALFATESKNFANISYFLIVFQFATIGSQTVLAAIIVIFLFSRKQSIYFYFLIDIVTILLICRYSLIIFDLKPVITLPSVNFNSKLGIWCSNFDLGYYCFILQPLMTIPLQSLLLDLKKKNPRWHLFAILSPILFLFLLPFLTYFGRLLAHFSAAIFYGTICLIHFYLAKKYTVNKIWLNMSGSIPFILFYLFIFTSHYIPIFNLDFTVFMISQYSIYTIHLILVGIPTLKILRLDQITIDEIYSNEEAGQALQSAVMTGLSEIRSNTIINNIFDIEIFYKSASRTGGDCLGFRHFRESELFMAYIGDVTGHGVSSAIITGIVNGVIKTTEAPKMNENRDEPINQFLTDIVLSLNKTLYKTSDMIGKALTAIITVFDLKTDKAYMINASHPFPIMHSDVLIPLTSANSSIMGISEKPKIHVNRYTMNPGYSLFLYTDGLFENSRTNLNPLKLKPIIKNIIKTKTASELKEVIVGMFNESVKNITEIDDTSFIIIRKRS